VRHAAGWHQSVRGVVRRTLEAAFEDNIPFLASALAFDLLLTAIPFLALLLALIGYLVQHQLTTHQLQLSELVERFLPPAPDAAGGGAFEQVERVLSGVVAQRARLTLFGVPLFLWFSTRLFGGLRAALDEVFDTEENRPWPMAKLIDLGMVFTTAALLVASTLLPAFEARRAFSTLLFFLVFKILPSRRIYWRTALIAATFCALAFEVAKRLYTLYLARFVTFDRVASDANALAFLLFFLWIYFTAYVFLLGGEVAETYDLIRMRRAQRVVLG